MTAQEPVVYIVKDSGVRCITAPCPVYLALRADHPEEPGLKVTDLDLSALGLGDEQRSTLLKSTHKTGPGLKVEATVRTVPHAGPGGTATILHVSRVL
ncbi:hypothetical protein [Cystobacter ferrugineus]|uniref:Uncharacterized protein n=1 Tax=Cystobacter ferrugineus TaxID=83449 RepID=A0A1L9BGZ5_9BACT|nr:hypothetical protein [Cystobacter ferrugineus]OJH41552.1 hypothetical protein BON30_11930 [Cystobacter ferrugineus]